MATKKKDKGANSINIKQVNPTQNQELDTIQKPKPPQYTDNIKDIILNRIMNGENPYSISQEPSSPHFNTIYNWIMKDSDFGAAIGSFTTSQAFKTLAIAQSGSDTPQDKAVEIKAIQWLTSKLSPRQFGDSSTLKLADSDGKNMSIGTILGRIE